MDFIKKHHPVLWALAALILLLFLMWGVYTGNRPQTADGNKHIQIEVIYQDGTKDLYEMDTQAGYLEEALSDLTELELAGSRTDAFGLMILSVNGVRADYTQDGAYWALLLDGTPCEYGVSQQPIQDQQVYSIVYTPAS